MDRLLSVRGWRLLLLVGLAVATPSCLEKQSDSEITIGGTYGGVGGSLANPGSTKVGNVTGDGTPAAGASPAPSATHQEVTHVDRPSGFGAEGASGTPAPGGTPAAVAADGAAPVGAPEAVAHLEIQHVDRPPGFGHDGESTAKASDGAPGGAPGSGLPQVASPFEKQFAGNKMVTVSGTLSFKGDYEGVVDIDCFQEDPTSPAKRKFVNKVKAQAPGTFTMKVPADYGKLIVTAFLDLESDGPSAKDPQGNYAKNPVVVGSKDVTGVDIVLSVGTALPPPPTASK